MIERRQFVRGLGLALGASGVSAPVLMRSAFAEAGTVTVKGVYSAPGLSYAGIDLAQRLGLWGKHKLNAEIRRVQGGPLAMVALTNNEAQFAGVASTDPVVGWAKGIKTLAVSAFTGALDMQFAARRDWMDKVGVGPKSPLDDKIKALKSARIGAATIGGGPAQYTRYLGTTVGLNPERDMRILAVGFGAARMAALRTNQVDVTVGSAPEADQIELEGFGSLYVDCANEVPLFREFPYTITVVTPKFADEQPDLVRRIVRTFGDANNLFHTRFGEVVDILKKQFPKIPPLAIERALQRARNAYPKDGRMTETMWANQLKLSQTLKMIKGDISAKEGVLWTNKFIG